MYRVSTLFFVFFPLLRAEHEFCDGFKTDFDIKKAIGPWHVVAVIPDTNFSRKLDTNFSCYQVDFSEVDEAGLKWMLKQRFGKPADDMIDKVPGEVIRLRYHTDEPFDIWSKAIPGVKGCYKQLLDLSSNEKDIHHSKTLDSPTLLHLLETENAVFLLQVLWGRISAIIYKRELDVYKEQLRPAYEFLSMYRRNIEEPKLCNAELLTPSPKQQTNYTMLTKVLH
ncbi:uncharacterized protein LOC119829027 [Zerene cesonia]|uniref:uncharacterized protein LOC119829027 n=1 Tax=Zerene cesonia TaxID=33412 RepID=UPI0018E502D5|nr:uncharacterized protein LOC119829027 [Zerene cesonia]